MIFPQKLDTAGRSDARDILAMVESYINRMQADIEANDSNIKKRLRELEKAAESTAAAAARMDERIGGVLHALETVNARLSALEDAVADLQENEP